jgi:hypothetical protein
MMATSRSLAAAFIAALALTGCDSDDKAKQAPSSAETMVAADDMPLSVEDSAEVHVSALVRAIDQANRIITLADSRGDQITLLVDESVKRLNEVQAGDRVMVTYKASVLAERRAATADEKATPVAVIGSGSASRDESGDPTGTRAQAVRVVTTIAAIDQPSMRVTLRGPMGDTATVKGRKPENVKRLNVGDTVVLTFTRTVAVAVDKIRR